MAHYYLAGLYWQMRSYGRAADELEIYPRLTPNAPDAEGVGGTIKDLRANLNQLPNFSNSGSFV